METGPKNIGKVLISEEEIKNRVKEIGQQITKDYAGKKPLLVGVLKGAFIFVADLIREIDLECEVDFMAISSYGAATRNSGVVRIIKDLDIDLTGRDVIVIEDIIDSGLTLSYLKKNLNARLPDSLEICALFVKDGLQKTEVPVKYEGFHIPPDFVIGYGLDVAEKYRGLNYLAEYIQD